MTNQMKYIYKHSPIHRMFDYVRRLASPTAAVVSVEENKQNKILKINSEG